MRVPLRRQLSTGGDPHVATEVARAGRRTGPPDISCWEVREMTRLPARQRPGRPGAPARGRERRGVAAVEFAVMATLLFTLVFGMIEVGRGMMVAEMLNNAARNGCRVAVLS